MYGLVDVKLTGTSCAFGLNSNRMRMHLVKGRAVLLAARKARGCDERLRQAAFVAYPVYRPKGKTFKGRSLAHPGGYGFVAYDSDVLCDWDPSSTAAPKTIFGPGQRVGDWKSRWDRGRPIHCASY